MIDKDTLRKMCEYEITPSLIGEAIVDFEVRKETALERARRRWAKPAQKDGGADE